MIPVFVSNWDNGKDLITSLIEEHGMAINLLKLSNEVEADCEIIGNYNQGILIAHITNKQDLMNLTQIFKWMKNFPKVEYRIVVVDSVKKPQADKILAKLKLLDIIDDSIKDKPLKYKLDLWSKSVPRFSLPGRAESPNSTKQRKSVSTLKEASIPFKIQETDGHDDDLWLLPDGQLPKLIINRWILKLVGPSALTGSWVKSTSPHDWLFELKEPFHSFFLPMGGKWICRSELKPDYNWKENVWVFTGSYITLSYLEKEQEKNLFQLQNSNEDSFISKNTEQANKKHEDIKKTFDREHLVSFETHCYDVCGLEPETNKEEPFKDSEQSESIQVKEMGGETTLEKLNKQQEVKFTISSPQDLLANKQAFSTVLQVNNTLEPYQSSPLVLHEFAQNKEKDLLNVLTNKSSSKATLEKNEELLIKTPKIDINITHTKGVSPAIIDDFFDQILVVKAFAPEIIVGSEVNMQCEFEYDSAPVKFTTTAEIYSLQQKNPNSYTYIEMIIPEENLSKFNELLQMYQKRQEAITEFLDKAGS